MGLPEPWRARAREAQWTGLWYGHAALLGHGGEGGGNRGPGSLLPPTFQPEARALVIRPWAICPKLQAR